MVSVLRELDAGRLVRQLGSALSITGLSLEHAH